MSRKVVSKEPGAVQRQEITMSWDLAMKLRWQHLLLQVQSSVFICILEVANFDRSNRSRGSLL